MDKINISSTIRELRQKAGLTQSQVSQKLNIQRQTYCNYENASRTPPLEIIVALSELYHVSVEYLICGKKSADSMASAEASATLSESEQKLLNTFTALPEPAQRETLAFIQFKKLFHCE